MNIQQILEIVQRISFAPSNLDMGWDWEVKKVDIKDESDNVIEKGFAIRCSFKRPDTNTGKIGTGFGRWYMMSEDVSVGGVVKTAWMCAEQIVKHELMESYLFDNKRIFDPHKSLEDLMHNAREQEVFEVSE
jgi:hypothetical protein